jgi:hypothetical protein
MNENRGGGILHSGMNGVLCRVHVVRIKDDVHSCSGLGFTSHGMSTLDG